jgi:hypothetical protein
MLHRIKSLTRFAILRTSTFPVKTNSTFLCPPPYLFRSYHVTKWRSLRSHYKFTFHPPSTPRLLKLEFWTDRERCCYPSEVISLEPLDPADQDSPPVWSIDLMLSKTLILRRRKAAIWSDWRGWELVGDSFSDCWRQQKWLIDYFDAGNRGREKCIPLSYKGEYESSIKKKERGLSRFINCFDWVVEMGLLCKTEWSWLWFWHKKSLLKERVPQF